MTAFPGPPLPAVSALRLVAKATKPRIKVPFGLTTWSTEPAAAVAVLLRRTPFGDSPSLGEIVPQLPAPSTLAPGSLVVIFGELEPHGAILGRWLGSKGSTPRADRCSALLALGYERIGGGVDAKTLQDLAWGFTPAV
jgi:hypothetical protein